MYICIYVERKRESTPGHKNYSGTQSLILAPPTPMHMNELCPVLAPADPAVRSPLLSPPQVTYKRKK